MLGAAASEIANMDATSKMRRQKLEAIKSHLRYLRVPGFLTVPIMEFYETLLSKKQALDDNDILCAASAARTMPPEPCTPGRTWPLPSLAPLTLPYTPLILPLLPLPDVRRKDMPSSLKVQLAVVLNEDFLKKVSHVSRAAIQLAGRGVDPHAP